VNSGVERAVGENRIQNLDNCW